MSPQYWRSPRFLKQLPPFLSFPGNSFSEAITVKNIPEKISFEISPPLILVNGPRRSQRISKRARFSQNYQVDKVHAEPTIESISHDSMPRIHEAGSNAGSVVEHILHFKELPKWMQVDSLVEYGYRREMNSFLDCFWSLFYFHNEFVNTWSHLLPAFFFLALLLVTDYSILYGAVTVSWVDNLVVQLYIAGTAACLFCSVCLFAISLFNIISLSLRPSHIYSSHWNILLIGGFIGI